jgi:predicted HTH domain antitoxin
MIRQWDFTLSIDQGGVVMQMLSIPYSDDLLLSTGQPKERLERELRFLLAVKLFELSRLSLGKAAQFCGMHKINFMDEIGRMGIPVINLDDEQIQDELRNA